MVLAAGLGVAAAGLEALAGVQKVYLMPMTAGLDQHLADQLAREGGFTVVVDPKQAQAVWTERIDAGFFAALNEQYPAAKPEAEKKKTDDSLEAGAKPPASGRSWGRSRGTIFLVGVASRQVVWSTFRPLEDTSPKGLDEAAREVVKRLKRAMGREK